MLIALLLEAKYLAGFPSEAVSVCIAWIIFSVMISGLIDGLNILRRIFSTEIAITNKRIIYKTGLLRRSINELNLNQIEAINLQQNLWERFFDYGTLECIGSGSTGFKIESIHSPLTFRRKIAVQGEPETGD